MSAAEVLREYEDGFTRGLIDTIREEEKEEEEGEEEGKNHKRGHGPTLTQTLSADC